MVGDVYFVVLCGPDMRESPCKFHDEIWASVKGRVRYACRLGEATRELSCVELFERYKAAIEMDALPASNVTGHDYAGRY